MFLTIGYKVYPIYAYLVDSGKFKYSLVDVNGKKIRGLHKDDIWWRTYLYRPDKEELIKNPEQISLTVSGL